MKTFNRRELLALGGWAILLAKTSLAETATPTAPAPAPAICLAKQTELSEESSESPFFQHFHQLSIPVVALLKLPDAGVVVKTSVMDQGSYDVEAFNKFISSNSLNQADFIAHSHDVKIGKAELARIAGGEKEVEIRVISANGNYVHNFFLTANPSTLAKVRRFHDGKLKI